MNKIGRKLQTRTMNLLRGLLTLAATFVLLTVVLQLQVEYNLLICIYAVSAGAMLFDMFESGKTFEPQRPGKAGPGGGAK